MGSETELCYEANPGMRGAEVSKLGSFAKLFKTALLTGKEYYELPVTENDKNLQLSILIFKNTNWLRVLFKAPVSLSFDRILLKNEHER